MVCRWYWMVAVALFYDFNITITAMPSFQKRKAEDATFWRIPQKICFSSYRPVWYLLALPACLPPNASIGLMMKQNATTSWSARSMTSCPRRCPQEGGKVKWKRWNERFFIYLQANHRLQQRSRMSKVAWTLRMNYLHSTEM